MVIVDLDGTLVDCNSFTEFVKFLFSRFSGTRIRLIGIVLSRKMRFISHHQAKQRIISIAYSMIGDKDIDEFTDFLTERVNTKVLDLIRDKSNIVLATAAPCIYVKRFAEKTGIDSVSATMPGRLENNGCRKVESLLRMGVEFDRNTVVITDHVDDLPLLQANKFGSNYIIRPSRRTLRALRREGIRFSMVD